MVYKNPFHLVMAPRPDFPLLLSSFTMFQPFRRSCCCFIAPSTLRPQGLYTVVALVGKSFPQTFTGLSPSLHSGLISNGTSSGWPFLTILSKLTPAHSLTPHPALFFPGAFITTYHIINVFTFFLVSLLEYKIYEARNTDSHTFTAVSPV